MWFFHYQSNVHSYGTKQVSHVAVLDFIQIWKCFYKRQGHCLGINSLSDRDIIYEVIQSIMGWEISSKLWVFHKFEEIRCRSGRFMPTCKRKLSNSLCLFRKQGFGKCFQLPNLCHNVPCKWRRFLCLNSEVQVVLPSLIKPTNSNLHFCFWYSCTDLCFCAVRMCCFPRFLHIGQTLLGDSICPDVGFLQDLAEFLCTFAHLCTFVRLRSWGWGRAAAFPNFPRIYLPPMSECGWEIGQGGNADMCFQMRYHALWGHVRPPSQMRSTWVYRDICGYANEISEGLFWHLSVCKWERGHVWNIWPALCFVMRNIWDESSNWKIEDCDQSWGKKIKYSFLLHRKMSLTQPQLMRYFLRVRVLRMLFESFGKTLDERFMSPLLVEFQGKRGMKACLRKEL